MSAVVCSSVGVQGTRVFPGECRVFMGVHGSVTKSAGSIRLAWSSQGLSRALTNVNSKERKSISKCFHPLHTYARMSEKGEKYAEGANICTMKN